MRSTIHLVSARDHWPFAVGIRRARRQWWMRVQREGVSVDAMTAAVGEIRPRLAAGPLRRAALERLDLPRLRDEGGGELLDLPRAPLPPPETPAPVRFLPTWDATLLVHARRTGILPEEHRSKVFSTKTPQSVPTFLVDGAVAGTWRHEDGRIDLRPFGRLDGATRRQLREEADRLADLHGCGYRSRP